MVTAHERVPTDGADGRRFPPPGFREVPTMPGTILGPIPLNSAGSESIFASSTDTDDITDMRSGSSNVRIEIPRFDANVFRPCDAAEIAERVVTAITVNVVDIVAGGDWPDLQLPDEPV